MLKTSIYLTDIKKKNISVPYKLKLFSTKPRNNKKNIHQFLGSLGFIPFLFFMFLSLIDQSNSVKYLKATLFYLSIVISFIGAAYWGIALNLRTKNIKLSIFSVTPAILVSLLYILNIDLF